VLQRRDGLCIRLEAPDERRIVRPVLVNDPKGDVAADVGLGRPIEGAERVPPDPLEEPVSAERLPSRFQVGVVREDPLMEPP
jgi:hypothetical protein